MEHQSPVKVGEGPSNRQLAGWGTF